MATEADKVCQTTTRVSEAAQHVRVTIHGAEIDPYKHMLIITLHEAILPSARDENWGENDMERRAIYVAMYSGGALSAYVAYLMF
ncbi:hypothetical protein D3C74_155250 [compost metagenome]